MKSRQHLLVLFSSLRFNTRIPEYGVAAISSTLWLLCATLALASHKSVAGWLPELSDEARSVISAASLHRSAFAQRTRSHEQSSHPLGVQILFIEPQEKKKKNESEDIYADVFLFDYHTATTSVEVVNANTGSLVKSKILANPHLPLNHAETNYVLALLHNHPHISNELSEDYQRQFGTALPELSELDMKVSIWVPNKNAHSDSPCFSSRCALISIFTKDHYNFSLEPIVNIVSSEIYLDVLQ